MFARRAPNPVSLLGDLIAALAVCALILFSFAQAGPAARAADRVFADGGEIELVFCGGGPGDPGMVHSGACHACRFDVAPLPVPLPDVLRADVTPVDAVVRLDGARAPPMSVRFPA